MVTDEKYRLSTYKEISVLTEASSKRICIVIDEVTTKLYVKKVLRGTDYFNFYVRLASLRHKNLIKIHDVICYDGATYVFEEYINGQTLQALLENEGVQPENKAADYIMQICDALTYLHSQDPPIIHRDIKPENIMLSADDVIKLVDFDIAREFKQSAKRDTTFMGTKEYAAPEQYGYKQTDGRTDIYAIGVLLHELLTGKLPQNNITYKGALQKVIVKCLRLEPKQRYQSVSALKKALTNTRFSRYKKIGICALSAFLSIVIMIVFCLGTPSYLYNPNNAPSSSPQDEAGQNVDDLYDLDGVPSSSSQTEAKENSGDVYAAMGLSSLETIMGQDYHDLYTAFEKIESFEERPSIILEIEAIDEIIRSITGDHYDSVANTFQEFSEALYYNIIYSMFHFQLPANNVDEYGNIHDFLILVINKDEMDSDYYEVSITYYDADLETTFYFTTNDDKELLPDRAFYWISVYEVTRENPVVFSQSQITDITGIYYLDYKQKIEIFEEAGEMKFSYTDIRTSRDADPLFVETIHKFDDNHYWLRNYSLGGADKLMLNFSENRLTIFDALQDSPDGVYGIERDSYGAAVIDLRGIYNKA